MTGLNNNPETKETQNIGFESFEYTSLYGKSEPLERLVFFYQEDFIKNDLDTKYLVNYIEDYLFNNNLTKDNLFATESKQGSIYIYLDNGEELTISIDIIKELNIKGTLGNVDKAHMETRIANINKAIESIYTDNQGILFNGEIDNKDVVKTDIYGKDLEGLTLIELKKILDIENKKLLSVYEITGETHKYVDLLKTELKYYAGVGDKYEGGARYFSLTQNDIDVKVSKLSNNMTITQMIDYIKESNDAISDNYKKSFMVDQLNTKLINSLCSKVFDRLKAEDAPNQDFIYFAKTVTGRGRIKKYNTTSYKYGGHYPYQSMGLKDENYEDKTHFEYNNIDIDDSYKKIDMANEALLYVMFRKDGVLDKAKNTKIELKDDVVGDREPKDIIKKTKIALNSLNPQEENYGEKYLIKNGYSDFLNLNKSYEELSFDEKVKVGALVRILDILKGLNKENIENLEMELNNTLYESFEDLNQSFADNFDESLFDWNGKSAKDLGLKGELAEVFDLYQDMNGGNGLFDWSDKNADKLMGMQTATVLGVGIIVGCIMFSPVIGAMAAGSAVSALTLFTAGAVTGAATGVASSVIQRQGYDTYAEGTWDIGTQVVADTLISGVFTMYGAPLLLKTGNVNPDLLFSKAAWTTRPALYDKGLIVSETVVTGMMVSPGASYIVGNVFFKENNFDTDNVSYQEMLKGKVPKAKDTGSYISPRIKL